MVELGLVRFLAPNRILHPFSFQLPGASEQKAPVEERVSARQLPAGRQASQTVRRASVLCSWCQSVCAHWSTCQSSCVLCLVLPPWCWLFWGACGGCTLTVARAASCHQVVKLRMLLADSHRGVAALWAASTCSNGGANLNAVRSYRVVMRWESQVTKAVSDQVRQLH